MGQFIVNCPKMKVYPLILLVVCAAFAVADLEEADNAVEDIFATDNDAVDDTAAAAYVTDRNMTSYYAMGNNDTAAAYATDRNMTFYYAMGNNDTAAAYATDRNMTFYHAMGMNFTNV